jgi:hypothetical protein
LKVSIFAWRLLRNRLPTKANLVTQGIISPDLHYCVTIAVVWSRLNTYFLHAALLILSGLWFSIGLVFQWRILTASQTTFFQFIYSAGSLRLRRSFMQLVWFACVWIVWNERNLKVIRNSANTVHQLLDKVKLFSYRWLRVTNVTLASSYIVGGRPLCYVWALTRCCFISLFM